MTIEIVSAALGGFFGWVLVRFISILVMRSRLKTYLRANLTLHVNEIKDTQKWLQKAIEDTVRVGAKVDGAPFYTRDSLESLTSVRESCLQLLTQQELVRLTKCIRALLEIEILFEGFCKSLLEMQKKRTRLDTKQVTWMRRRATRITALVELLPTEVKAISHLPEDYSGRISPALLVPEPKDKEKTVSRHAL